MLNINGEKYLVEKEISAKYGLSIHWFRRARYEENGPVYHKLHGNVYYKEEDVIEWFKENLIPSR
ncbi:hypothetical protein UFOVP260_49 [uncultured Caudovirales phage]|uniref:Uncharacterized protein n=1 Tax=uncultured Caudovirales phage TaxID=2100421 RepID=A0A6J5L0W8_9CAUD|nr:hypothetical protein UFOVP85_13 [uncultured Caudovirales phage]CAB4132664.1 hypothetical protein UFOVP260_49 [uncultured Caudovirales phage]CAB4202989.1 hypothetical protein UFOVP1363_56 [uncultured Caudovirales phage]CAB5207179.1 hypothetical protein UFOVP179_30 [uncultured Caudovirales phage]